MNFPFYIARRYLFSKKSTNAINVISGISVVGVAIATMALVVTLSVFNGFHDMIASFFTQMDPQLKVSPVKGKTVAADHPVLTRIRQLPQVDVATEVMEDQALAGYGEHQAMVQVKGVDDNYDKLTHIREVLEGDGEFELHAADMNYGILGMGVAYQLGVGYSFDGPLKVYAPRREGQLNMANLQEGFVEDEFSAEHHRAFGERNVVSAARLQHVGRERRVAVSSPGHQRAGGRFGARGRYAAERAALGIDPVRRVADDGGALAVRQPRRNDFLRSVGKRDVVSVRLDEQFAVRTRGEFHPIGEHADVRRVAVEDQHTG